MNQYERTQILNSQRDAFKRHGYHPNALLWSNVKVQEIRFKILTEIGIEAGDCVLDIGCGFGDFSAYLAKRDKAVNYTGIDLSEELIQEGRKQFPDIKLIVNDMFEYDPLPASFDYVTLSGTLNRKHEGSEVYALKTIERMYQASKKGVAFNLLDARHEWTASRWDLQSFHPERMMEFVSKFADKHEVIDDYLDNDFTFYLWKNSSDG